MHLGATHLMQGLLLAACLLCLCAYPSNAAYGDELAAVKERIEAQVQELDDLSQEVEQAKSRVDKIDAEIQQTLDEIDQKQAEYARLQSTTATMAVGLYKDRDGFNPFVILENGQSLHEIISRFEMNERVLDAYTDAVERTAAARDELKEKYRQVSDAKDEQQQRVDVLKEKVDKLESSIAELREEEEALLSVEQQASLAQAAAAAQQVVQTFETGTVGLKKVEWKTGLATAYGGSSDDSTPNPGTTATGTVCDDWSVGVAVPLAWGPSQYYGQRVEISYNGQSIIAPVVDCGYMGNGYVSFDLQPGVFKAFGCDTCSDWGVREVRYRFL